MNRSYIRPLHWFVGAVISLVGFVQLSFAGLEKADVGFSNTSYFTPVQSMSGTQSNFTDIHSYIQASGEGSVLSGGIETEFLVQPLNVGAPLWYLDVGQAYVGTSHQLFLVPLRASIGRAKRPWSLTDEAWKLGVWQPRFRWDFLDAKSDGLTGFFADFEGDWLQVTLFGSPLFIPEMGPPYEFKNGNCTSQSAWFNCPESTTVIEGVQTNVQYQLHQPALRDLLLNPNFSGRVRIGAKEGIWGQVGAAYKPINQVAVAYDAKVAAGQGPQVSANLKPYLRYHEVGSIEVGYRAKPVDTWASLMVDRPLKFQVPAGLTYVTYSDAYVASFNLSAALANAGADALRMDFGYLKVFGGNSRCIGELCPERGSPFEARYSFKDAVRYGVQVPIPIVSGRNMLGIGSGILHDFFSTSTVMSAELYFSPVDKLRLGVGADFLSSGSDSPAGSLSERDDFVSLFRGNDRIRGGMTYVF